jgi:hypothetical protein
MKARYCTQPWVAAKNRRLARNSKLTVHMCTNGNLAAQLTSAQSQSIRREGN